MLLDNILQMSSAYGSTPGSPNGTHKQQALVMRFIVRRCRICIAAFGYKEDASRESLVKMAGSPWESRALTSSVLVTSAEAEHEQLINLLSVNQPKDGNLQRTGTEVRHDNVGYSRTEF